MQATRLNSDEQHQLLSLARAAITAQARGAADPQVEEASLSPALRETRGCFVTLTHRGELRGCIGNLSPRGPLFQAVMENARGAAFRDSRFLPVSEAEVPELRIEVSVLSEPEPLVFHSEADLLRKLRPNVDGVVLRLDGRTATFLPQVWRKFPEPEHFLNVLAQKAGLSADSWRSPDAVMLTYQTESFAAAGGEPVI